MDNGTKISAVIAYLVGLYGENPNGLLWIGGHADGWKGRTFSTPDSAARYALELDDRGGAGVYHRSTTLAVNPERRGEADDSAAVYYFALDADIVGPGHKAENLPAGREDIERLIEKAGFPAPTAWVFSGGGFYPQWRFAEPLDVRDTEMRAWVTESFTQISAHFLAMAGELGWKLDNVRDLARVFRLPGTTNRKTDQHVIAELISTDGDAHDLGVLASLARPSRGVVISRSAPATDPMPQAQDLVDDAARQFTRAQAVARVNGEGAKLKEVTSGFNAAINSFAMTCAHFPWLIDREKCGELMIKWLGKRQGWDAPDRDDRLTINSAYTATEAGKSWVAVEVAGPSATAAMPADGPEGEITGGVLPPPNRPFEVVRELVTRMPMTGGRPHWSWWRGDFYRWTGAHWDVAVQAVMEHWLYRQTGDATFLAPVKKQEKKGEESKVEFENVPWAPTKKRIGDLVHALGIGTIQRFAEEDRVLAAANGVIAGRRLEAHDPDRFNLWSMPFDYDPEATSPGWDAFLEQVLPGDREAKDFLGEWFGYVLSGRTDHQKMAALIGEKRSGKGTIARVLTALLGTQNVSGLNLNLMAGTFGMEPLIGKALGVAGDVRWASRNIADAVPILLGVIGEDDVSINRKNKAAWHGRLGTRFMLMSNETPTFNDRSGALGGRMVFVRFDQSFYGREDISLTEKLLSELPGILNWSLDGLDRLNGRGRFTEPASGDGERQAQRRLADPVGAFLDDWCEIGEGRSITLDHLYLKYRNWCDDGGRTKDSTTKEVFARDLNKKVQGLRTERTRINGKRVRTLYGVGSDAI